MHKITICTFLLVYIVEEAKYKLHNEAANFVLGTKKLDIALSKKMYKLFSGYYCISFHISAVKPHTKFAT
jgi:hypothetical protein